MGTHRKRRMVAVSAVGTAIALVALVAAPQTVTAEPLIGEAGMLAGGVGSAYLEIDGVTPAPAATTPPTAPDHSQDIALQSMSWKISTTAATGGSSTGSGAGRATFDQFTVVKPLDTYTPLLLAATATNHRYPTVSIFLVRTRGKTQLEALRYRLTDAVITSDANSTAGDGTETLQIDAKKIEVDYYAGTTEGNVFIDDTVTPS